MKKIMTLIFLLASLNVLAQMGGLDHTFVTGTGTDNAILSMVKQPDGKMLISGAFTTYNGTTVNRIARLNTDGTLDTDFVNKVGAGFDNLVFVLTLQPGGKILATGFFSSYNGTPVNRIARLNADGTLDTEFNPGFDPNHNPNIGIDNIAHSFVTLSPGGKIIVGGFFEQYNGTVVNRIIRINDDGSLDNTFQGGERANNAVYRIVPVADGKMIIVGNFTKYDGTPVGSIARIDADGDLDHTFNIGGAGISGTNMEINAIIPVPDNKFLIAGNFVSYNGTPVNKIVRINADGSLDASFNPEGAGADDNVYTLIEQPNGKILVGGQFFKFNNQDSRGIVRINANGAVDETFNAGAGAEGLVYDIVLQPNGKAVITGSFTKYNNVPKNNIAGILIESVLPVSFGRFTAKAQSDRVKLDWNTFSETNNQFFTIYRSSDAIHYTTVANQVSKGAEANNYTVFDNQPTNGINYYRLTQKDIDGKVAVLANVAVNFSLSDQSVKIWPNPVVDLININLPIGVYQTLLLANVNGQKLQELILNKTQNSAQLNLAAYPKGVYIVQLKGGNNTQSVKVLK